MVFMLHFSHGRNYREKAMEGKPKKLVTASRMQYDEAAILSPWRFLLIHWAMAKASFR
jgi:hypothetical protein